MTVAPPNRPDRAALVFCFIALCVSGCSRGFLHARAQDAADVGFIGVEYCRGAFAQVECGPFCTGLGVAWPRDMAPNGIGLAWGNAFTYRAAEQHTALIGGTTVEVKRGVAPAQPADRATWYLLLVRAWWRLGCARPYPVALDGPDTSESAVRLRIREDKSEPNRLNGGAFGGGAGLWPLGVRGHVNLLELGDCLAGWLGCDLLHDDVSGIPSPTTRPQPATQPSVPPSAR